MYACGVCVCVRVCVRACVCVRVVSVCVCVCWQNTLVWHTLMLDLELRCEWNLYDDHDLSLISDNKMNRWEKGKRVGTCMN